MKPLVMTFCIFVGLLVGLGFGGFVTPYIESNAIPTVDREKQWWNLLQGAIVGMASGYLTARVIIIKTKD